MLKEKAFLTPGRIQVLVFQILSKVGQPHIALAHECVVKGEGATHGLWLVAATRYFKIVAQQRTVVGMGAVLNDFLGTAQCSLASEIGHTLFGDNDVHVVLGGDHMAAHGHNGTDGTILGGRRGIEYADGAIALIVARATDAVHQFGAADVA